MLVQGTASADVLNGGATDDTLYGAGGADRLTGNSGNDVLTGDDGNDTLSGGAGEDYLIGGGGNDNIDGGAHADWAGYEDATAAVKVDLNLTTAQNTLGGGIDTLKNIENLQGSAFNDALIGNASVNYLHGGAGADSLFGGAGDDHLDGGAGNDTLNGGNGDDIVSYENGIVGGVTLDLNLTTGQANGAHGTDTLISIEAVWGSGYDDKFTGNAADNYLFGGAGDDSLSGGAGADVLDGSAGNDTIVGGQGADDLTGGAGDDLFQFANGDSAVFKSMGGVVPGTTDVINAFQGGTRGTGTANGTGDTLDFGLTVGTAANYAEDSAPSLAVAAKRADAAFAATNGLRYLATQVGADTLVFASDADGGEAHNMVTLKGVGTAAIGFNNMVGKPPVNPNLIVGTEGADTVLGSAAAAETLQGLAGDDTLVGDGSQDTLLGGDGADTFKFDVRTGSSMVDGGAGGDTIDFSGSTTPAHGVLFEFMPLPSSPPATFFGVPQPGIQFSNVENLRGTNFYDILGGDDAANMIFGGGGGDLINGLGGNDTIDGGDGDDSLRGNEGNDLLIGGAGDDVINGLNGNDTITAGDGADTLRGDEGADVLTGGAGNDLFDVEPGQSTPSSPDQILDFQTGDRLDFRIVQGTVTNYAENTATTIATATSQASAAFAANNALRYVATQVGADVQLFTTDADGGETHSLVTLKNLTTASIDFTNILGSAPPPINPYLIVGTDGPEALVGTAAPETINGLGGADTITGGGNADVQSGGGGDDLFKFAPGDSVYAASTPTTIASYGDTILGFEGGTRGAGTANGTGDMLDFGIVRGTVTNYIENTAASQGAAVTQAGAAFAANSALRYVATAVGGDVLVFASAAGGQTASLVTLSGADVGALGFLNIAGTAPLNYNIIDGTEGRDTLVGGSGNDSLTGFADNDSLSGAVGNDTLLGGDGRDTLNGGLGNDRLSGGANEDRFVFGPGDSGQFFGDVVTPGTADILTDFQTGIDVLTFGTGPAIAAAGSGNYVELSTVFTTYADAELATKAVFAGQASLIYVLAQVGADSYVFVDVDPSGGADTVVYLQGVGLSGINASDIV